MALESIGLGTEARIRGGLALTLAHYRRLAAAEPAFFLAHRDEILRATARRSRAESREPLGARDDLWRARAVLKHARIERADVASFVLTRGVAGLLDAALAHEPAILAAPAFEAELYDLIAGYLLRDRAGA